MPHLARLARQHPAACQCFLHLLTIASRRNTLAVTIKQLADITGLAADTVEGAVAALLRLGYIRRLPELGRSALAINAAIAWLDSRHNIPRAQFLDPLPFPPPPKATKTVFVPVVDSG